MGCRHQVSGEYLDLYKIAAAAAAVDRSQGGGAVPGVWISNGERFYVQVTDSLVEFQRGPTDRPCKS